MSQKHENLLSEIFRDPIVSGIQWREIEALLKHLGATFESLPGTRVRVNLNDNDGILHRPQRGSALDRKSIQHLREFLGRAGIRATPAEDKKAT